MDSPSASLRALALRLLAAEKAYPPDPLQPMYEAVRVCDKLGQSLTRFAGADGFASLLGRSLALARLEVPSLARVAVQSNGILDGLEALAFDEDDAGAAAAIALSAHLLGLLVTFIGEPLTLRLVRESWPDASLDAE